MKVFIFLLCAITIAIQVEAQVISSAIPDRERCWYRRDLFTSSGFYMKSICVVSEGRNYEDARRGCEARNMNLFAINSDQVYNAFRPAFNQLFKDNPRGYVWVNGRRVNGNWVVNYVNNSIWAPLYNRINWVQSPMNGSVSGDCLLWTSQYEDERNFKGKGQDCGSGAYHVCEYIDQQVSQPEVDLSLCWTYEDLYYKGSYQKSMCVVEDGVNSYNAKNKCKAYGMNLFTIENAEQLWSFKASINKLVARHSAGGTVRINGKYDRTFREWYVEEPNRKLTFDKLNWWEGPDKYDGRNKGDCLVYTGRFSPFSYHAIGDSCDYGTWFVCEYKADFLKKC